MDQTYSAMGRLFWAMLWVIAIPMPIVLFLAMLTGNIGAAAPPEKARLELIAKEGDLHVYRLCDGPYVRYITYGYHTGCSISQ